MTLRRPEFRLGSPEAHIVYVHTYVHTYVLYMPHFVSDHEDADYARRSLC